MSDDSSHLRSRPLKIGELIDKEDESDDTRSPELLIAAEALGALKNGSEQPKTTILDKMASHPLISNPINYMLEKTINTSSNIVLLADEKTKRARYEQSSDEVSDEKTQTETGTLHKRPRLEKSASGSQLSNRLPPPTQPRFARANSNLRQQVTISSAISTQKGLQDLTELSVLNLNIESRRRLTMLINFLKIGNTQLSERIENLLNALSAEQEKKSARSASPEENSVPTPAPSLPPSTTASSTVSLASLINEKDRMSNPEFDEFVHQLKHDIVGTVKKIVNVVSKVSANSLPEPARSNVREMLLKLPANWAMSLEQNMSETDDEIDSDAETQSIYEDSVEYPDQTKENPKRTSKSLTQQLLANLFKYRNKTSQNNQQPNNWFKKSIRDQILNDHNGKVLILAQESLDMINKIIRFCNDNLDKAETWNLSKQSQQAAHLISKLKNITYVTPIEKKEGTSMSGTEDDTQDCETIVVREQPDSVTSPN